MSVNRRQFLIAAGSVLTLSAPGSSASVGQGGEALARAVAFLIRARSGDGAWRSDVYGQFKDGTALTPLAVVALTEAGAAAEAEPGAKFLEGFVTDDRSIRPPEYGFDFPVYTASLAASGAVSTGRNPQPWLDFLHERRLAEPLGWGPADPEYGGWGYARGLPRKPRPGQFAQPLTESNLSATAFVLDALIGCGSGGDRKALAFVKLCQNFGDDPGFDDGGFHFIGEDPVRNKAGVAGTGRDGRRRFHSYGSATADGLRSLLACGLPTGHPRVAVARDWLVRHFRAGRHPGNYVRAHERDRGAVDFYYAASLARTFRGSDFGPADWAGRLAESLVARQREDGSWRNPVETVREDDPIVATCLAIRALAACERQADSGRK